MIYCFLKKNLARLSQFIEAQVKYEYVESKKELLKKKGFIDNYTKPYMRTQNPAFFFLLELVVILFFAFALYKWFSYFNYLLDYTPNLDNKWDISDIPYDQVERIELVRKSWLDWYTYYYTNGIQSADNQANYYIQLGNLQRPLIMDTIQYVIIPMSIGYVVWFCIKYYDYVIAASWGWFIMMYSFMTKKIECTLAKKWYIQFVTGWKKCSPSFSKYLRDWFVRFVQRPLRQEQLNYMRAYDELKFFKDRKDVSIILSGIRGAIENIIQFIKDLFKRAYNAIYAFFASIGNLFLKIYHAILSLFGYNYKSETNTGEDCECEPPESEPESKETNNGESGGESGSGGGGGGEGDDNNDECKDSLLLDLAIISLILYPFRNYLPIESAKELLVYPVQAFIQNTFNVTQETSKSIYYISLAVLLFMADRIF